jgi:probable selenium-dependent hydroxylase accessory protein YqeC
MARDAFRFLDSWTRLLPRRGGAVVALVGSGGCTTLLLRMIDELTSARELPRILVTQTTPHPVPLQYQHACIGFDDAMQADERVWENSSLVWITGDEVDLRSDRRAGLDPSACDSLRGAIAPDVVLVQAHASCATPLRIDAVPPCWPLRTHLAVVVAPLGVVGRPWNERSVAGARAEFSDDGEPRRVSTDDVLEQVLDLVTRAPEGARPLPFLTSFGSYRDLDGMFALVQSLWDPPRLPVVCLGELLGDERRDAADLAALAGEAAQQMLERERVYAIYPALMDSTDAEEEI